MLPLLESNTPCPHHWSMAREALGTNSVSPFHGRPLLLALHPWRAAPLERAPSPVVQHLRHPLLALSEILIQAVAPAHAAAALSSCSHGARINVRVECCFV
jgi:hypothetical protein